MVKYYDCPKCGGHGTVAALPSGRKVPILEMLNSELFGKFMKDCEFCLGTGHFDEDEYIIMKLEGRV